MFTRMHVVDLYPSSAEGAQPQTLSCEHKAYFRAASFHFLACGDNSKQFKPSIFGGMHPSYRSVRALPHEWKGAVLNQLARLALKNAKPCFKLRNESTLVGFEPTRGDTIGLAGRRLNHSAKVSVQVWWALL